MDGDKFRKFCAVTTLAVAIAVDARRGRIYTLRAAPRHRTISARGRLPVHRLPLLGETRRCAASAHRGPGLPGLGLRTEYRTYRMLNVNRQGYGRGSGGLIRGHGWTEHPSPLCHDRWRLRPRSAHRHLWTENPRTRAGFLYPWRIYPEPNGRGPTFARASFRLQRATRLGAAHYTRRRPASHRQSCRR